VRVRFIETVKGFDPLDALLLRARHLSSGGFEPNAIDFFANRLRRNSDQIIVSVENLERLGRSPSINQSVPELETVFSKMRLFLSIELSTGRKNDTTSPKP
jgi:hypothetical protein